jgi:hypothetical protein
MASPRFQHTVIIPQELEEAWQVYRAQHAKPESFNAFINRLILQEMELLCVTTALRSITRSAM